MSDSSFNTRSEGGHTNAVLASIQSSIYCPEIVSNSPPRPFEGPLYPQDPYLAQTLQRAVVDSVQSDPGKKVKPFVTKLDHALEHPELYGDCIRWNGAGSCFILVHGAPRLVTEILPAIFAHSNLSSFTRQLGVYGFVKLPLAELATFIDSNHVLALPLTAYCAYSNEYFVQGGDQHWRLRPRPTEARIQKKQEKEEHRIRARTKSIDSGSTSPRSRSSAVRGTSWSSSNTSSSRSRVGGVSVVGSPPFDPNDAIYHPSAPRHEPGFANTSGSFMYSGNTNYSPAEGDASIGSAHASHLDSLQYEQDQDYSNSYRAPYVWERPLDPESNQLQLSISQVSYDSRTPSFDPYPTFDPTFYPAASITGEPSMYRQPSASSPAHLSAFSEPLYPIPSSDQSHLYSPQRLSESPGGVPYHTPLLYPPPPPHQSSRTPSFER